MLSLSSVRAGNLNDVTLQTGHYTRSGGPSWWTWC